MIAPSTTMSTAKTPVSASAQPCTATTPLPALPGRAKPPNQPKGAAAQAPVAPPVTRRASAAIVRNAFRRIAPTSAAPPGPHRRHAARKSLYDAGIVGLLSSDTLTFGDSTENIDGSQSGKARLHRGLAGIPRRGPHLQPIASPPVEATTYRPLPRVHSSAADWQDQPAAKPCKWAATRPGRLSRLESLPG